MKSPLELRERRVCSVYVMETFLSGEIEKDGASKTCSYCEEEGKTFSVDQIADSVGIILGDFFRRTDYDHETAPRRGEPLQKIISELTETMDNTFAEDVRYVLAERAASEREGGLEDDSFGPDARYAREGFVDTGDLESDWWRFERSLKTETRFFNKHAESILAYIFEGIDRYSTISRRPIVVEAGPGTSLEKLYRAREFQSERELRDAMKHPDLKVGPPPTTSAVAGRMNPTGVAVFYGATDPEVALAEVRPPVGCKVLVGCFEVIRPLRLLDLAALKDLHDDNGSFFDDAYRSRLKRAQFLRGLCWRISRPVMPNDQPIEYLPTQAIADFLATAECPPLPLDGIVYPSVQAGYQGPFERSNRFTLGGYRKENFNVVLFHKAARVQSLDQGADVSVSDNSLVFFPESHLNDGPDVQYTVSVRSAEHSLPVDNAQDDAALKFSSLQVHCVKAVKFDTVSSSVSRFSAPEQDKEG